MAYSIFLDIWKCFFFFQISAKVPDCLGFFWCIYRAICFVHKTRVSFCGLIIRYIETIVLCLDFIYMFHMNLYWKHNSWFWIRLSMQITPGNYLQYIILMKSFHNSYPIHLVNEKCSLVTHFGVLRCFSKNGWQCIKV